MIENLADTRLFEEVVCPLLAQGLSVRFQARGASMSPAIRDGEVVEVIPTSVSALQKDDIVLAKTEHGFRLHRIVLADPGADRFITRGDRGQENDPVLAGAQILGIAQSKEVWLGRNFVRAKFKGVGGWMLRTAARAQYLAAKAVRRAWSFGILTRSRSG
ncbi:MAG: S24/S26 family peptidase [Candidatus Sulfotelmatobacter sp.]